MSSHNSIHPDHQALSESDGPSGRAKAAFVVGAVLLTYGVYAWFTGGMPF